MYVLRRVAASAITQQPSWQLSTLRPAATRVTSLRLTASRPFHQSRIWFVEENGKKPAEQAEASPAEAATSGETVTTEPSAAEEQIREESVLDKSSGEASAPIQDAVAESSGSTGEAQQPAQGQTTQTTMPGDDAVSESSGTTSAPLGSSEAQPQHHRDENVIEKAQDVASSATQSVSSATSSAARAARSAFQDTAASNQQSSGAPASFPPRQPSTSSAPRAQNPGSSAFGGFNTRTSAPPSRILYIGNLFFEVTAPQLEGEFGRFGQITNSRVVTDSRGLSKGFAYVEFANQESADQAVRELDQKVFQGRRMAVQYHVRREPRGGDRGGFGGRGMAREPNPPSKTLFIGNMSYQMSDRDLNDLFREIRNVLDVRVAIDRRSGQPRGFAHADFIDVPSAQKAKEHLEKKVVYGRQLKVDFSASSSATRQDGGAAS